MHAHAPAQPPTATNHLHIVVIVTSSRQETSRSPDRPRLWQCRERQLARMGIFASVSIPIFSK